jgi:hypothetical protein
MPPLTDKLADALRALYDATPDNERQTPHATKARAVLVEYDWVRAEARDPDTDAFLAAAREAIASVADEFQMCEDVPIDRVDDGAWVTVRVFVPNFKAGLPEDD